jgi:hypothetical protein
MCDSQIKVWTLEIIVSLEAYVVARLIVAKAVIIKKTVELNTLHANQNVKLSFIINKKN